MAIVIGSILVGSVVTVVGVVLGLYVSTRFGWARRTAITTEPLGAGQSAIDASTGNTWRPDLKLEHCAMVVGSRDHEAFLIPGVTLLDKPAEHLPSDYSDVISNSVQELRKIGLNVRILMPSGISEPSVSPIFSRRSLRFRYFPLPKIFLSNN
ncbi:hypothetical protein EB093_03905 [bacterium]|nr:hypothetical protein [bacterium]